VYENRFTKSLRYDPGITSVMPGAGGCLTRKKTKECRAVFAECRVVFVDFFHFLLLFVTFLLLAIFTSYFLLLKGVRFVTFCYFFTACNFQQLLFTIEKGQGLYSIHCATRNLKGCILIFFLFPKTVEGDFVLK
jgi:hypothetical protein